MTHIALVGPMHSGKSTLASMLEKRGYTRIGLADAVKDAAISTLNCFLYEHFGSFPERQDWDHHRRPPILIDRQEIEDHKAVFRPFLQWLGTDFARQYLGNPNCWIEMFAEKVKATDGPIVCDDVRFPNEAEALRALGFRIIRLYRPEEDRIASITRGGTELVEGSLLHASERMVDAIQPDESITCSTLERLEYYADILSGRKHLSVV